MYLGTLPEQTGLCIHISENFSTHPTVDAGNAICQMAYMRHREVKSLTKVTQLVRDRAEVSIQFCETFKPIPSCQLSVAC